MNFLQKCDIYLHLQEISLYLDKYWKGSMKSKIENTRKNASSNRMIQTSKSTSLTNKIIESHLRQHNEQYQQLLITVKQLQLEHLEQESINKQIMRSFARKKASVENMRAQKQKAAQNCEHKKMYLQNYYAHLDNRLKNGSPKSINMFKSLETFQKNLKDREKNQKEKMEQSCDLLREEAQKKRIQLIGLREMKDKALGQYEILKRKKEKERSQNQIRKQEESKKLQKLNENWKQMMEQLSSIRKEKDNLEKEEKLLKKLLNIEEEHRKYWMMIENGIKKQIIARIKQQKYKESVNMEYAMKRQELKNMLNQRKYEKDILLEEVENRNKQLSIIRNSMNDSLIKYSQLDNERMNSSNRRSSN